MALYFTVAEANLALPGVIKRFEEALARREDVSRLEQKLQAVMSGPATMGEYADVKRELNSAVTAFYGSVEGLEKTGVVIKSIEDGLLDFPSKRFDGEVWLCWKYGETKIRFWHEKDSGFMGRKPLEISDDELV